MSGQDEPAWLRANAGTAQRIEEILGISSPDIEPGIRWVDFELSVPTNEVATVRMTFFISVAQLHEFADLAGPLPGAP